MSSGYSLWLEHPSRWTVSEIINDSDSEECTEILTLRISQNTFVLVAVVAIVVKRKFLLHWNQGGAVK
jgi:hypothetical protein